MTTNHAQHSTTRPTHGVVAEAFACLRSWPLYLCEAGQYTAGNSVKTGAFVDLRSMLVTIHDPGSGG